MSDHSYHPWLLDPGVTFLNHGSFGACPAPVLALQQALQGQLEREPVSFMLEALSQHRREAKEALAQLVGGVPRDFAFVPNATYGVNAVLRSFSWQPGDHILATNHGYNACHNAVRFLCERYGVKLNIAEIPFPLTSSDQALEAIVSQVTPETRLALIDHVTSATALVLPIHRIVTALKARGIETLVDGAHAPGMLALDLPRIGASYYTGNAHKWLCAPKGCAFLWVHPADQMQVRPLAISHGANEVVRERSRYQMEFDWTGTDDFSPYLCLPHAISFMESQKEGGWPAVRQANRALVLEGRQLLCEALEIPTPAPDDMIGSMVSLPLPPKEAEGALSAFGVLPLQQALYEQFAIQVPVSYWPAPPHRIIRISAQLYNSSEQYAYLARSLKTLLLQGF